MEKQTDYNIEVVRPSKWLYLTEPFRALRDLRKATEFERSFRPDQPGDGHPVLVIPGLMGSHVSTHRLRKLIRKWGYTPYDWGLGRNYARLEDVDVLLTQIDRIYKKHQTRISLIGWSLGGVYARELAKQRPRLIRQVITLGSPFGGLTQPNNAEWLVRILKGSAEDHLDESLLASLPLPPPVPTLAIYSREDGVVSWQVCMEQEPSDLHQNAEVRGSHMGLVHNLEVWQLVAKRLGSVGG